jgi:hypothetical protein
MRGPELRFDLRQKIKMVDDQEFSFSLELRKH